MNFDDLITVRMYGADWCGDCRRAKVFLKEHEIEYDFVDVDLDEQATKKLKSSTVASASFRRSKSVHRHSSIQTTQNYQVFLA